MYARSFNARKKHHDLEHQAVVNKRNRENKRMHEAERDMGLWFWLVLGIIALLIMWVPR